MTTEDRWIDDVLNSPEGMRVYLDGLSMQMLDLHAEQRKAQDNVNRISSKILELNQKMIRVKERIKDMEAGV